MSDPLFALYVIVGLIALVVAWLVIEAVRSIRRRKP